MGAGRLASQHTAHAVVRLGDSPDRLIEITARTACDDVTHYFTLSEQELCVTAYRCGAKLEFADRDAMPKFMEFLIPRLR